MRLWDQAHKWQETYETIHLFIVDRKAQCFVTISERKHAKRIH